MVRRGAELLVAVVPIATLLLVGSDGLRSGGRFAASDPHIVVAGHYAPLTPPREYKVGRGPESDLLLIESSIDLRHGAIVPVGNDWKYLHRSPVFTAEGAGIAKEFEITAGDKIVIDAANTTCAATTDVFELRSASRLLVGHKGEQAGTVMLADPTSNLEPLTAHDTFYLGLCGDRIGLSTADHCSDAFVSIEGLRRNVAATASMPLPLVSQAETLVSARDPRLAAVSDLRVGVPLLNRERGAFWRLGSEQWKPVMGLNALRLQDTAQPFVILPSPTSDHRVPAGRWFRPRRSRSFLIRRTGDTSRKIVICRKDDETPQVIGESDLLRHHSDFMLGDTRYQLDTSMANSIALVPIENPNRFHLFLSLSSGRLNTYNRRHQVPSCGRGRLQLVGTASAAPGVTLRETPWDMNSTSKGLRVPLPAWVNSVHPAVIEEHLKDVNLGSVCAEGSALFVTPGSMRHTAPQSAAHAVDSFGRTIDSTRAIPDSGRFLVGGHIFEFHNGSPPYEQVAPLVGFVLFLTIMSLRAVRTIRGAVDEGDTSNEGVTPARFVTAAAVITAAMAALMTSGAVLLMRMAVSDRLIGKADYVHRQLFMSAVAMALFTAIVAAAVASAARVDDDDKPGLLAERTVSALLAGARTITFAGILIGVWIVIDAGGWLIAAGDWLDARATTRTDAAAEWLRSFAYPHVIFLMGAPAAIAVLMKKKRRALVNAGKRVGLDRVWRVAVPDSVPTTLVTIVLLLPLVAYCLWAPVPSFLRIIAWISLSLSLIPAAHFARLSKPRWSRIQYLTWIGITLICLFATVAFIPSDGLDLVEMLLFGLVVTTGALAVARVLSTLLDHPRTPERMRVWYNHVRPSAPPAFSTQKLYLLPYEQLLILTFAVLALGLLFRSGRGIFGIKPAEFAICLLAPGLAMLLESRWDVVHIARDSKELTRAERRRALVPLIMIIWIAIVFMLIPGLRLLGFSIMAVGVPVAVRYLPRSGWSSQRIDALLQSVRAPLTTLILMLALQLTVMLLYAAQGDFGPLMVLVPSMFFTVGYWVMTPDRASDETGHRFHERLGVLATLGLATLGVACAGYVLVQLELLQNLPFVGSSIRRAAERLDTFNFTLYTIPGSWTVEALWIAAQYQNERFISNLHSDLALIAFRQSFGVWRTVAMLTIYIVVAGVLGYLAAAFHRTYGQLGQERTPDHAKRRVALITSLTLWFATFYLLAEVLVHVLTNFNVIPQTGLVLPWVSSGGSAAIAFCGLMGVGIGLATQAYIRITLPEKEH